MAQAHAAALAALESSVGELAFAAVCRLVGHCAASEEFVLGLVRHTCALLHGEVRATLRLHPRDVALLRGRLQGQGTPDLELQLRSLALQVIPDATLALGGCVVEAASGHYEGGLDGQLRRLHAVLTRASGDTAPAED